MQLAEVVTGVVLQQDCFQQWSPAAKSMLSKIDEDLLTLAGDRHILRGSVAMRFDYDDRQRHRTVCRTKMENPVDILTFYWNLAFDRRNNNGTRTSAKWHQVKLNLSFPVRNVGRTP